MPPGPTEHRYDGGVIDYSVSCILHVFNGKVRTTVERSRHSTIMRLTHINAKVLRTLLKRQKIATMDELKSALGTTAPMTVVRKLRELVYKTSYSHGGRYYTLNEIARFDSTGLWSWKSAHFSRFGTLLTTLEKLIVASDDGYFAHELTKLLHVETKTSLLKLCHQDKISRERVFGLYLYCAAEPSARKRQIGARRARSASEGTRGIVIGRDWVSDEIKAAIILFVSILDEKQQRLFAGVESLQFGPGGNTWIADLLGLDPHTVAKGRRQLLERDILIERIRAPGAGRPQAKKKRQRSSKGSNSC